MVRDNWIIWGLKRHNIVAIPTDTIYGFSCLPTLANTQRLSSLKQRDSKKGFILLASDVELFREYVAKKYIIMLENAYKNTRNPTTFIVPSTHILAINGAIALRVTADNLIKRICFKTGSAIISTSCNISRRQDLKTILKLRSCFKHKIVFYGRPKNNNKPSTIINLTTNRIIRA